MKMSVILCCTLYHVLGQFLDCDSLRSGRLGADAGGGRGVPARGVGGKGRGSEVTAPERNRRSPEAETRHSRKKCARRGAQATGRGSGDRDAGRRGGRQVRPPSAGAGRRVGERPLPRARGANGHRQLTTPAKPSSFGSRHLSRGGRTDGRDGPAGPDDAAWEGGRAGGVALGPEDWQVPALLQRGWEREAAAGGVHAPRSPPWGRDTGSSWQCPRRYG